MNMYVCPECRKTFKVKSSNKQIKCPKCPDAILSDMRIDIEEWGKINNDTKKAIIDANLAALKAKNESNQTVIEQEPENKSNDSFFEIPYVPEKGVRTEGEEKRLKEATVSMEQKIYDIYHSRSSKNSSKVALIWLVVFIGIFALGITVAGGKGIQLRGCSSSEVKLEGRSNNKSNKEVRCAYCSKVIWSNGRPIHCSHEFLNTYKCSYCGFKNVIMK